MRRFSPASLLALALFVLSNEQASAGSVHYTKAEVRAERIVLYEHEMGLYNRDPALFDEQHPVLGRILASEEGFDAFLAKHTFPRLLCKHTPFLWRVIDGDILYHRLHPFAKPPSVPDTVLTPPGGNTADNTPPGGGDPGGRDPGGGGPGGGSGPTIHPASVPEPSSLVLLATAGGLALVAAVRRRIFKRLTTAVGMPRSST
jgi:PEP-CTERM motif